MGERIGKLVTKYRRKFLIPPRWQIDINILCPDEMHGKDVEGSMAYEELSNASYRLRFNCTMAEDLVEWVVMHELMEAITAPYAELCFGLIKEAGGSRSAKSVKQQRHRDVRDDTIEWVLAIIAPDKRPPVTSKI